MVLTTMGSAVVSTRLFAHLKDATPSSGENEVTLFNLLTLSCSLLAENCDEANYVRIIEALCLEHQIPMLKIGDNKTLGEWAGLCKIDREGNARKVVGCSCVVVRSIEDCPAWDFLQTQLKNH